MKKYILALLALVGMVAGLTLTSCGGGGGGGGGNPYNLSGVQIYTGPGIPGFNMVLGDRIAYGAGYHTAFQFGSSKYDGTFTLLPGYPKPNDDGSLQVNGQMGIQYASALTDPDFMAWVSGKSQSIEVQLPHPVDLEITIREDETCTIIRTVKEGLYFMKVDASFPIVERVEYGQAYASGIKKLFQDNK